MSRTFNELFIDCTKHGTKIQKEQYHENGRFPIIDQGQSYIAGYVDTEEGIYNEVPAIIFGDHTRVIKYVDFPFFLGADGVKVLRNVCSDSQVKYLYYALRAAEVPDTGYNRHFKWLRELSFKHPTYNEQQKIADILDKTSELIAGRKKQLEKLDLLVKSRFVEMFGARLGDGAVELSEICTIITDGTHQPPKFIDTGIPFLLVSNIVDNEINYTTSKFISRDDYDVLIKRTPIEVGDVLLTTVGSYGNPAVVKSEQEFCFQRHIAYLKPKQKQVNSVYLHAVFLSSAVREQIEVKVKGIAQKTLNLSELKTIRVNLPPLDLQTRFADFVRQADKSKFEIQQGLEKLELQYNALMQQYFSEGVS